MLAQFGIVDEVTPGVPVVAAMTFLPLVSESMKQEIDHLESAGIISGRRAITSDQWALGAITVSGDIGLELYNKNLRTCFKHMIGGESGSGPYTYVPGDLTSLSFTAQIGRPDVGGTVDPFTYSGCKVASWEIAIAESEIATLGLSVVGMKEIGYRQVTDAVTNSTTLLTSATAAFGPDDVGKPVSGTNITAGTTIASVTSATNVVLSVVASGTGSGGTIVIGVALAAASYTSGIKPLHYDQATLTLGGTAFKVKSVSFAGDNGLDDSRRFLGQRGIDEPLEAGLRAYTGTIEAEFTSRTAYNRFVNGTEAALVATVSNGTESVTITENVRFDGDTPAVSGPEIVGQTLPFKAVASGADSTAITAVISTA
jgi:hypothetical protein